jgi:hypothetical protein
MHHYERIALWVVLFLIVLFLAFKQTSGFTSRQVNLMSMAEFRGLPQALKDAYVQNMTPIVDAFTQKITNDWNSAGPSGQQQALAQIATASQQIVANINRAPNIAMAANPQTHANVQPVAMPTPAPSR